jgi:3-hydroxyisobutyrate dehydrogenase-like beta-hydroxyacid dehydrogenase
MPDTPVSKTQPSIAIVGLGLMGTVITQRFLKHGWKVFVWNRSREKADNLCQQGAIWEENPFANCNRVLISLYSSDVVKSVIEQFSNQPWLAEYVIDTTTGDPEDTLALAHQFAGKKVQYMDAPISGSSEQTLRGEATVLVGADENIFEQCDDIWQVLGTKVLHTGPVGTASQMKLVTNLVLGLNRLALSEGLVFAESLGINPSQALQVLKESAARSGVMETKGRKMIERDFTPQARLAQHLKDVYLILRSAERNGLKLPTTNLHGQLLEKAVEMNLGEADNSAIIETIRGSKDS